MLKPNNRIGYLILLSILFFLPQCKNIAPLILPKPITLPKDFTDFQQTQLALQPTFEDAPPYQIFFKDSFLIALIDTALQNNYDLRSGIAAIEKFRAEYQKAAGLRKPFAQPLLGIGFNKYGTFTQEAVGNYDVGFSNNISQKQIVPYPVLPDFNIGLQARWEIDIWNKLKDNRRSKYLKMQASVSGVHFLKTLIVAEVASRYYELIALDYTLKVLNEYVSFQEKSLDVVKVQKASGYATGLAVQQLEAALLTSKSTIKEIELNIINLENILNGLIARPFAPIPRNPSTFEKEELSILQQMNISTKMLLNRPDIQQAELLLSGAQLDVEVARKSFFPSLNLSGFLGFTSFSIAQWFNVASIASNLLSGLTAPLINRSQIKAFHHLQKANARIAFNTYQKSVINGYNEVQKNLRSLDKLKANYLLQKEQVSILDSAKKTATDLFISNYAGYLEIVTAQRSYLEAFLNLVLVKQRLFLLNINLYRNFGGGWK